MCPGKLNGALIEFPMPRPFGGLRYAEPDAISNAIGCAELYATDVLL